MTHGSIPLIALSRARGLLEESLEIDHGALRDDAERILKHSTEMFELGDDLLQVPDMSALS